jgi:hypothetical protein
MCLDAVKPRSLILAQFSEGNRPTAGIGPAGAGTVSVLRTSTLWEIKQPPVCRTLMKSTSVGPQRNASNARRRFGFDRDRKLSVHGSLLNVVLNDYEFYSLIKPPDLRRRSCGDVGEAEPKALIDVPHARSCRQAFLLYRQGNLN